jgi:hypothetical protein
VPIAAAVETAGTAELLANNADKDTASDAADELSTAPELATDAAGILQWRQSKTH